MRHKQKESLQTALTLLLGPKTSHELRVQAMQHLLLHQKEALPLLLQTLNTYPEPTMPSWPWSPSQYTYIGRLLLQLCQNSQIALEDILTHSALTQNPGPVLWMSIIASISLLPHEDHEMFLCQGLTTPWINVHNAAVLALTIRAHRTQLAERTHTILRNYQNVCEDTTIAFAIACAQLNNGLLTGLNGILALLQNSASPTMQKTVLFWLATDPPSHLIPSYKKKLISYLLPLLLSPENEIAQGAAHALSRFALPTTLDGLYMLLATARAPQQHILLMTLEEMARFPSLQKSMRVHNHLTHMLPLLQSSDNGVRRQACYTLAAIGGEYATAVFGTVVSDKTHPSHLYAIESLRHLYHNNRAPLRTAIIRWLLQAICESNEVGQACALESLIFLLWQAHGLRKSTHWQHMSKEVLQHESIQHVLQSQHTFIRQKAIKLLGLSSSYLNTTGSLHPLLLYMLRSDRDPQIRAGVADLCRIMKARWALPDLLQALLDPDTNVAQAALTSLETIATAKDATVLCTLTEITHLYTTTDPMQLKLADRARLLLQKWQEVAPTGLVSAAEKPDTQNS